MTTIQELRELTDYVRNLPNKRDKLDYLNQQSRDVLNFLSGNIKKDGIAKVIASEISISKNKLMSDMEQIINIFSEASTLSRKKDKVRLMRGIWLVEKDREFVLTTLYGSLKLGITIPTPEPGFGDIIKPMLCRNGIKQSDLKSHIIESKWNGIRCICMNINNKIYTYTRNGKILDINDSMRDFFRKAIPSGSIVDGEIIDSSGDFFSLKRKSDDILYVIFDIIFYDEKSIINYSLITRKEILYEYIRENDHVKISKELNLNTIQDIDDWIISNGAEGVILKDSNSLYNYGKREWIKYKHFQDITCNVIDYTEGTGKRQGIMGAINVIPEGSFKITKVGSGFTDVDLIYIKQLIDSGKNIKVDVKYQEITPDGAMQFPIFLRIREIN